MLTTEELLEVAKEQGYTGARLEMMGGGVMAVWIPLTHPVYEYALLDWIGLGLYTQNWDGEETPLFDFQDGDGDPTYTETLNAFEWMEKTLKLGAN
jgi:hypothetical protein